jgi:transcription elongation factor GreA
MARKTKAKAVKTDDSLLVTQHGYDELLAELEQRKQLRDVIAAEIDEARQLGDLSENDPYKQAMERKDLNESRIEQLEIQIAKASVVEKSTNDNVVTIGRSIEIVKIADKSKRIVHLVGSTEANPMLNKISIESPMGQAILNSRVGDTFSLNLPSETVDYKIVKFID